MAKQIRLGTRDEYEKFLKEYPGCAFCDWDKEWKGEPVQIVLHKGKNWNWLYNRWPYWPCYTVISPKEHIKEVTELLPRSKILIWFIKTISPSVGRLIEMIEMYQYGLEKFRKLGLSEKYIVQFRMRDNLVDSISGNKRPEHFHINFVADKDHLYDPTIDPDAVNFDYTVLMDKEEVR